jgi:hypothetical protein
MAPIDGAGPYFRSGDGSSCIDLAHQSSISTWGRIKEAILRNVWNKKHDY